MKSKPNSGEVLLLSENFESAATSLAKRILASTVEGCAGTLDLFGVFLFGFFILLIF